jgi:hypothetical protein
MTPVNGSPGLSSDLYGTTEVTNTICGPPRVLVINTKLFMTCALFVTACVSTLQIVEAIDQAPAIVWIHTIQPVQSFLILWHFFVTLNDVLKKSLNICGHDDLLYL